MLRVQGVDKQSASDRLCLHSLFSNRPTQSHWWDAHTCTHSDTCTPLSSALIHSQTPSVKLHMVCYRLTLAGTLIVQTHAQRNERQGELRKRTCFKCVPPEASVLRKWSYHDKGWKRNNGFITFPHVSLHRGKRSINGSHPPIRENTLCFLPRGGGSGVSERQPPNNHCWPTNCRYWWFWWTEDSSSVYWSIKCPCVLFIDAVPLHSFLSGCYLHQNPISLFLFYSS